MPLLEKYLVVRRSTLAGAGKGLFTTKDIPRGKKIVEYRGKVSTWKDVDDKAGLNGYIYYVSRNHVIDASEQKQELARYANDAKGLVRTEGIRNNCTYNIEGVRVYIVAMKNIPAGSELLVGYGKEYWDIIKENWAEKEKKAKGRKNGVATADAKKKINGVKKKSAKKTGPSKKKKTGVSTKKSK